jgi:hypothetical protein
LVTALKRDKGQRHKTAQPVSERSTPKDGTTLFNQSVKRHSTAFSIYHGQRHKTARPFQSIMVNATKRHDLFNQSWSTPKNGTTFSIDHGQRHKVA